MNKEWFRNNQFRTVSSYRSIFEIFVGLIDQDVAFSFVEFIKNNDALLGVAHFRGSIFKEIEKPLE